MIGTSKNIWGFDPRSVPGCQLWLDAADTSSMTLSGSSVTQWRDKSGSSNHFTTTSGTPTSILDNGRNVVNFTSGAIMTSTNQITSTTSSAFFIVSLLNSITVADVGMILGFTNVAGGDFSIRYYGNKILGGTSGSGNSGDLANGAYYVNGTFNPSFGSSTYLNTYSIIGTVAPSAVTSFLTLSSSFYERYFIGNIAEFLYYPGGVTSSQRQQIEGYLAWKWGLTTSVPSIHPFSSIRPHLRTFQPADIPGCQLWLDAADASSLVLSGSSVIQWNDKSGNGYHMNTIAGSTIWSGTPAYPTIGTSINGLQTVNFVAQSGLKQATTLDGVKNLFWVGRIADATGSGTGPYYFLLGHDTHYDWHTPIGQKFIQSGAAQDGIANAFPASLFTSDANAVTNTAFSSINLPSPPNVSLLSVSGITGTTRYQGICYDRETHIGWCGDLAEVLIFNTALTTSQRQQVEGYLAQKWGLTPYLPVISPLSIPGCSLWLDGADPAGTGITPSNGATVSTWVDKATAKNATATGTPTYLTGGGVNFNGSSYFLNQNFIMNVSQRSIFIVMQETYRTQYAGIFSFIPTLPERYDQSQTTGLSYSTTDNSFQAYGNNSYSVYIGNANNLPKAIYNENMNITAGSGYLNGTNTTNVTATYTAGTCSGYTIGGRWQDGSVFGSLRLNGIIYEIIVFNTPLNTSQRQSIEGYLARKWGISISATLPSPHPFKSILPATAAHFYPTDITGCSLWLDAADASIITLSGSNVSLWGDKSGLGNNLSNTSGTFSTRTTTPGGYPSIFVNGGQLTSISNNTTTGNLSRSLFMITQTVGGASRFGTGPHGAATPPSTYGHDLNVGGNGIFCPYVYTASDVFFSGANSNMYCLFSDYNSATSTLRGIVNFTLTASKSTTLNTTATPWYLGYRPDGVGVSSSHVCEIILYNSSLTTEQRQKVEGYLAHKWGLVNSLPSKHPYKPSPPIFPPNLFFPTPSMYSALFNSANNTALSIPSSSAFTLGTNNHTIEFWFYQTNRTTYDGVFMYGDAPPQWVSVSNYIFQLGYPNSYVGVIGYFELFTGGNTASLNAWHHFAVVRNGNTFTAYIDGISHSTATSSISIGPSVGKMVIGSFSSTGAVDSFTGYISNFRLVNGTAVYTSNFTPPTTPLTAIPNTQVLIQGLVDRGPNAFTLTNNGGVTLSTSVSPF
jgi:hypothetical protein